MDYNPTDLTQLVEGKPHPRAGNGFGRLLGEADQKSATARSSKAGVNEKTTTNSIKPLTCGKPVEYCWKGSGKRIVTLFKKSVTKW